MADLAIRIARLQNGIVRELNDIHIFVRQALPTLEESRSGHALSTHRTDRRYYVPAVGRIKFARRTDAELKEIYDRFTSRRLYESFLISAIGEFEGFLGQVLKLVFQKYPQKLAISVQGIAPCRHAAIELILNAESLEQVLSRTVDEHLRGVFFATPRAYVDYFSRVVGTSVDDPAVLDYYELKATRDLLVHNNRLVNSIYLEKAGTRARGALGDTLVVDSAYFDGAIATLKRLSGIIKRDAAKSFRVGEAVAAVGG